MPYTIQTHGGETVGEFSTKKAAISAAEARLTVPFSILSPSGQVVHSTIPTEEDAAAFADRQKEITNMTDATKTADPKAEKAEKPAPAPAKPLSATAVKEVLKFNPAWNDADKKIVTDLITKNTVSDTKTSPKGDTIRLIAGTKTVAWVNTNRIDFPDGGKVKFSTARAPKPKAEKPATAK